MLLPGLNKSGGAGDYNPIAKAAIQFIKLNLPSKADPGSETMDNLSVLEIVQQIGGAFAKVTRRQNFDKFARHHTIYGRMIDTSRSYVRLNSPEYKKLGGGLRVKRVTVYDNWNSMTGQKDATYGQEYIYTTTKELDGVKKTISSGVASFEPGIGNEENPFRIPISYVVNASVGVPSTVGYVEEPLGEAFYPAASVGYSKVRVRSIHTKNLKSANGFEETEFFTTYDFPTKTDKTPLNKKRYRPQLLNFFKVEARNYVSVSQGISVELNDMNGKTKSTATYSETDPDNFITSTKNYYKIDDHSAEQLHLSNKVWTINSQGNIDTNSIIGKDIELMTSMREQQTNSGGIGLGINMDIYSITGPP
ncbi:MAG: hypothetical protein HY305_00345, partial [Sphingobacteriales bacterium]|nr:hypothetical protein [Sphingobacteriales bacterium]